MEIDKLLKTDIAAKILVAILIIIVIFGVIAIAVYVAFGKSVIDILTIVYSALGLNGLGAVLKGLKDAPIQQQQALNQTAQIAKNNDVSIPIASGLSNNISAATPEGLKVWTPSTLEQTSNVKTPI